MIDFFMGFVLSFLVGLLAYKRKSLDLSGLLAAIVIGTFLYGFVGWFMFFMLMVFFVSSSLISRFNLDKKASNRNYIQVFANGGLAFVLAIIYAVNPEPLLYVLILTSIAVSASDTWSSEIGRLSKTKPKVIFTNKEIPMGLSGGVTKLGFLASLAAGLVFALLSLFYVSIFDALFIFMFAFIGGVFDSLLGVIQVKYKDIRSNKLTEKITDFTIYHSGIKWLDNNLVNFLSNSFAVLLLFIVYIWL